MKKLLLYILLSLACIGYGQQLSGVSVSGVSVGSVASAFDSDYQTWLNRLTTLGYALPSSTVQTLQNNLVVGIKADGNWAELDRLWIFAHDGDSDGATVDFITPTNQATKVNSPTWTSKQGFNFPTTSYIGTQYNPSTSGVKYQQNSASFSVHFYSASNGGASNRTVMAPNSGAVNNWLIERGSISKPSARINTTSTANNDFNVSDFESGKSYSVVRNGASSVLLQVNGITDATATTTSTGLPSSQLTIGDVGFGIVDSWKIASFWVGSSNIDQSEMHSRISTYMSSLP